VTIESGVRTYLRVRLRIVSASDCNASTNGPSARKPPPDGKTPKFGEGG
jgi:hypothetical protein